MPVSVNKAGESGGFKKWRRVDGKMHEVKLGETRAQSVVEVGKLLVLHGRSNISV